jgi:uncharacterized protein YaaR (DUF327 family)
MARIDSLGETPSWHIPEKKKAGKKERAQRKTFSEMVESAAAGEGMTAEDLVEENHRRSVEELLDGIFSAGDELKKNPTVNRVKEYRQRVRAFIKYAVARMIALEETTSGANIMKRKRFTIVKVIDGKLEALAASVLSHQKEQLSILAQIDEINGLLVDLVS